MRLTEHFTLEEMTFSQTAARQGISNAPTGTIIENLTRLCNLLEEVRKAVGRPLHISSGYRCPALNTAIGGAKKSQHINGCAADFFVKGLPLDDIIHAVLNAKLGFDQMIREYDRWVHISVPNRPIEPPRGEVLIIDLKGTRKWHSIH